MLKFRRIPVRPEILFAFFWVFSVVMGFRLSKSAPMAALSVLRSGIMCDGPLPGLLLALLWPVCLAAAGCGLYGKYAVVPLCVGKGLSYGFLAGAILRSIPQGRLFCGMLLLFADTGMLWVLCWFSLRRIRLGRNRMTVDLLIACLAAVLLLITDRQIVTPFYRGLFLQ